MEKNKCTKGLTEATSKEPSEEVGVHSVAHAGVEEAEGEAEEDAIADRPRQ